MLASLEIVDQKSSPTDLRLEVVTLVFQILALALNGHDVNRAAFAESVGFEAVAEAIKLSQLMLDASSSAEDSGSDDFKEAPEEVGDVAEVPTQGTAAERIISILYSFLTNDFAHSASSSPFAVVRRQLEALDLAAAKGHPSSAASTSHSSPPPSRSTQISLLLLQRADSLQDVGGEAIEFAEVVPLLLNLQAELGVGEDKQEDLSLMLLCALRQLAGSSRRSQVALSEAGVLGIGLERLFPSRLSVEEDAEETKDDGRAVEGAERELWMAIAERLLELGADTSETRRLFQCAVKGWEDSSQQGLNENVLELM